jgi:hypothetical protein
MEVLPLVDQASCKPLVGGALQAPEEKVRQPIGHRTS